jgi:hypothetical protein
MRLSALESLPAELLEPIFVESGCNTSLLQASDLIARKLSSNLMYKSACDHQLTEVHGDRALQTQAQTFMFASKWMTWDFFQDWITQRYGPIGCLCGSTERDHKDPANSGHCFDAQWPPNFEDATTMVFSRSHLPQIAFVKGHIPIKLLRGPWTPDKISFLRFLLWITAMTVDWRNPEHREAAIEGRRQAVLERNLEAVEVFNHNRRLGKMADLSMVLFAVTEAGCDRSIVFDTLSAVRMWKREQFPEILVQLQKWCQDRIDEENPKGLWLQTKLEEVMAKVEPQSHRVNPPQLNKSQGDYDGGPDDQLVVHDLEWNRVRAFPSCHTFVYKASSHHWPPLYIIFFSFLSIFVATHVNSGKQDVDNIAEVSIPRSIPCNVVNNTVACAPEPCPSYDCLGDYEAASSDYRP